MKQSITRDERTTAVENSSYRWAYVVLSFGLLLSVTYRSLALGESSWDLLALVVLGGVVATFYQGIHRVLSRRWAFLALACAVAAAATAAAIVLLR